MVNESLSHPCIVCVHYRIILGLCLSGAVCHYANSNLQELVDCCNNISYYPH